jgi:hypothetical protein
MGWNHEYATNRNPAWFFRYPGFRAKHRFAAPDMANRSGGPGHTSGQWPGKFNAGCAMRREIMQQLLD